MDTPASDAPPTSVGADHIPPDKRAAYALPSPSTNAISATSPATPCVTAGAIAIATFGDESAVTADQALDLYSDQ